MKYAVVKISDKQYKVREGDTLKLDRLAHSEGKSFDIKEVLFYSDERTTKIGQPGLRGVKVEAKIIKNFKDKKIEVRRFKAKSRYRKNKGHRQPISEIKIEKIEIKKG